MYYDTESEVFRMIAWIWLVLRTFFVDPTTLLKKSQKKNLKCHFLALIILTNFSTKTFLSFDVNKKVPS